METYLNAFTTIIQINENYLDKTLNEYLSEMSKYTSKGFFVYAAT